MTHITQITPHSITAHKNDTNNKGHTTHNECTLHIMNAHYTQWIQLQLKQIQIQLKQIQIKLQWNKLILIKK
jgi:hypothetical protein